MRRYVPRGREWNRRSIIMPADAQPFLFTGRAAVTATKDSQILQHTVPVKVNGARISLIRYGDSLVIHNVVIRRNGGELADYPFLGTNNFLWPLHVFFVFEPNDTWAVHGYSSGATTAGCIVEGWYF